MAYKARSAAGTIAAAAATAGTIVVQQGQGVVLAAFGATWTGNVQPQLSIDGGTVWYMFGDALSKGVREAYNARVEFDGLVRLVGATGFTGSVAVVVTSFAREIS